MTPFLKLLTTLLQPYCTTTTDHNNVVTLLTPQQVFNQLHSNHLIDDHGDFQFQLRRYRTDPKFVDQLYLGLQPLLSNDNDHGETFKHTLAAKLAQATPEILDNQLIFY